MRIGSILKPRERAFAMTATRHCTAPRRQVDPCNRHLRRPVKQLTRAAGTINYSLRWETAAAAWRCTRGGCGNCVHANFRRNDGRGAEGEGLVALKIASSGARRQLSRWTKPVPRSATRKPITTHGPDAKVLIALPNAGCTVLAGDSIRIGRSVRSRSLAGNRRRRRIEPGVLTAEATGTEAMAEAARPSAVTTIS